MAGLQAAVADFQLEYGLFNLNHITQLANTLHHFNQPAHLQKVQVSRSLSARMMVYKSRRRQILDITFISEFDPLI